MMSDYVRLSTKQKKAIAALLSEPTTEKAAARTGVTSKTIRLWLRENPDFRQALATAESEAISEAARSLSGGSVVAVELLRGIISDDSVRPSERRKAASQLLSHLPRLRMLGEIEATVKRLEEMLSDDH